MTESQKQLRTEESHNLTHPSKESQHDSSNHEKDKQEQPKFRKRATLQHKETFFRAIFNELPSALQMQIAFF